VVSSNTVIKIPARLQFDCYISMASNFDRVVGDKVTAASSCGYIVAGSIADCEVLIRNSHSAFRIFLLTYLSAFNSFDRANSLIATGLCWSSLARYA
jgi:hypothetical protein